MIKDLAQAKPAWDNGDTTRRSVRVNCAVSNPVSLAIYFMMQPSTTSNPVYHATCPLYTMQHVPCTPCNMPFACVKKLIVCTVRAYSRSWWFYSPQSRSPRSNHPCCGYHNVCVCACVRVSSPNVNPYMPKTHTWQMLLTY